MPRQKRTRILQVRSPLQGGFHQVPHLAQTHPRITLATNPPKAPSQVFLGEIRGDIDFRPNARPVKYAKISPTQITANRKKTIWRPSARSEAIPENRNGNRQEKVNAT